MCSSITQLEISTWLGIKKALKLHELNPKVTGASW